MTTDMHLQGGRRRAALALVWGTFAAFLLMLSPSIARASRVAIDRTSSDLSGTVTDSASGGPLGAAELSLTEEGRIIANTTADDFGRYTFHNIAAGRYTLSARFIGFRLQQRAVTVVDGAPVRADFRLAAAPVNLAVVEVRAEAPLAIDTRTGDQTFKQHEYHGAPTNSTSQILQQSISGAARAPTGEVHIRGQHAEYTYYVDGIPVPAGISGSLNELFDPQVVNRINFQTGGWDAEYGNKNAAVVNVTTKSPSGGLHADVATYGGAYAGQGPRRFSGQSASVSTNAGRLGIFLSGAYQLTDMRREPVVVDTVTREAVNFHNHGEDAFAFGKLQYAPGSADLINLDLNASRTRFEVPYDPRQGFLDDDQRDVNAFANLGWRHQFGGASAGNGEKPAELFSGLFYRHGSLLYTPNPRDSAQFVFAPDPTPYNLNEDRSFNTAGLKLDYTVHPSHDLELKAGTLAQLTTGSETFQTVSQAGRPGPSSNSELSGGDVGVYAQMAFAPVETFELRTGVRYDAHRAPFAGTRDQVSPRIRLNFYASPATTIYAYYGRLFIPTNVEDLRAITSVSQGGTAADATVPERDHFYEAGLVHRFGVAGLVAKLSGYRKESSPGIDDNTIPGSAIVTSVNITRIRADGLDGVLEIRPEGPLSGYLNAALSHAVGFGTITGGFFPATPPKGAFDLDHDQRLSLSASATYSLNQAFASATAIYGSGLTNGRDPGAGYGTALLDFNRAIKVDPSTVVNVSAGYTFAVGDAVLRPQLYVENLFDKKYLLKGAFFSGASVGRPRSLQLRLNVGF
ncbi:MAG: hypothetical protein NVS9B3_03670 [Gemmatimonadaceae bacterium]